MVSITATGARVSGRHAVALDGWLQFGPIEHFPDRVLEIFINTSTAVTHVRCAAQPGSSNVRTFAASMYGSRPARIDLIAALARFRRLAGNLLTHPGPGVRQFARLLTACKYCPNSPPRMMPC